MPRFVLLRHKCPTGYVRPSHWDLMLEEHGALRTWALSQPIRPDSPLSMDDVERLADHRLEYLELEGPVSNQRGNVRRVDRGEYQTLDDQEMDRNGVRLCGSTLRGRLMLQPTAADSRYWRLDWVPD